jgi:hypothetical protein
MRAIDGDSVGEKLTTEQPPPAAASYQDNIGSVDLLDQRAADFGKEEK